MAMSPCRTRRPFLSQLTAFLDLDSAFWAWKIFQEAYEPHTIPMHRTLFLSVKKQNGVGIRFRHKLRNCFA